MRGWAVTDTLELDQVFFAPDRLNRTPVNLGVVGPTELGVLNGAWGLASTPAGAIVVTGRLAQSVILFSSQGGPLRPLSTLTFGQLVDAVGPGLGLTPARGLERAGPVAVERNRLYIGGLDGLGLFNISEEELEFVGVAAGLRGADDILAGLAGTGGSLGPVLIARCRDTSSTESCFGALDPSELVLAQRSSGRQVEILDRWGYNPSATDGRETLLGDGSLSLGARTTTTTAIIQTPTGTVAVTQTTTITEVFAAFEGAGTVIRFDLPADSGTIRPRGTRRVVAPWQLGSLDALPAFDAPAVATSTSAPLRTGQVAVLNQRVFVAVRSGGFVAHFAMSCFDLELSTDSCLEVVCLDETGDCSVPSAAATNQVFPYAIAAGGGRVYVGLDVVRADGTVTTRIAILEVEGVGDAAAVILVGFVDA